MTDQGLGERGHEGIKGGTDSHADGARRRSAIYLVAEHALVGLVVEVDLDADGQALHGEAADVGWDGTQVLLPSLEVAFAQGQLLGDLLA